MCVALCVLYVLYWVTTHAHMYVHTSQHTCTFLFCACSLETLRYPSSALQIFQKESHPSSYKLGSGAKEGLSLFGEPPALVCGHMHL